MAKIPENFEQNYDLLEYLALQHMGSTFIRTPLTAIKGYSQLLLQELDDASTDERQQEYLESINYIAEQLMENIGVFVNAVPFIFGTENLYTNEIDLLKIISEFISTKQEKTGFQIEQDLPTSFPIITADEKKIYEALHYMVELVKQIHPMNKGRVDVSARHTQDFVIISISTEKREVLQLKPNPELFIVQSIAELHGGKLQIENGDDSWDISLILPLQSKRAP
ncbi:sensor histidine kinase [Chloroflexota bacterium]